MTFHDWLKSQAEFHDFPWQIANSTWIPWLSMISMIPWPRINPDYGYINFLTLPDDCNKAWNSELRKKIVVIFVLRLEVKTRAVKLAPVEPAPEPQ